MTIITNGQEFKGAGKTLEEALNKITPPKQIKTKTVIRVEAKGRVHERVVKTWQINRIFSGDAFQREIMIKNFKVLFDL